MDTRNRTTSLDVAKCLAAFLVVAIHADFPGMFGKYVNAWARIAGPLFFIISGYYYPILASQGKQKRQIRKLLKYLLIGSTVFIVYECTVAALKGNLSECLNIWITSDTVAKFLFFNAFPFAGHLWYMYALLYVYAILNLFKLWKLPEKTTGIIIIILLIFNYILSFFPEYYSYRNFLFTGLPYVLLGCLIRKNGGWHPCKTNAGYISLIVFLSGLLAAEIAMYHSTGLMLPRDHYLSTFPLSLCAFSFALDNAGFGNKSMAAAIGQRYSSYIYMYHPLVISLFSSIPWLSQNKLYVSIQPIVVFTATTACIILIQGLYSVIQKTRQRPIS